MGKTMFGQTSRNQTNTNCLVFDCVKKFPFRVYIKKYICDIEFNHVIGAS